MPPRPQGTNWSYIIAGGALFFSLASSVINGLTGGTEKLDKRVGKIEDDLVWKYVTKDLSNKDIGYLDRGISDLKEHKVNKDVYEQKVGSIDRQLQILRDHSREIDRDINQTFNARDAFTALQSRILELERATRATK